MSSARSAGESAIGSVRAQPSAEIGRVERWKLRTGDFVVQLERAEYLASWKMRTGDFVVQL